ncbi:MAG: type II secretion system F family protein [Desulfobaccales bacterium]
MVSDMFHSVDSSFLILVFFVFLSFFFLIRATFLFLASPARLHQRRLKKRLREVDRPDSSLDVNTLLKQASLEKSSLDRMLAKFSLFNRLQIMMLQADLSWNMGTFLAVAALSGLVLAGVGLAKWGGWGALAGGGLGLLIPYKILARKKKRRLQKFEKQLPDALDLLARGLKAGHAFPTGLQQVAKEMADPLGTEFFKTFREFNHGLNLNTALLNLCDRINLRDLSFFTTAVLIQRETGGNLTEILEKISVLIRERFKLRNQVKALTAEGRLSGLILLLLPPVLVVILMAVNPEYELQLFHHPMGRTMCGVALGFQLLGMWCIHKIVNIKV